MPVYLITLAIASLGLPVGLSKQISAWREQHRWDRVEAVMPWVWGSVLLTSAAGVVVLYLLAPLFARHVFNDMRTLLPLRFMAPAIVFVSISSTMRGYFHGQQNMVPTAISQTIEQVFRITGGAAAILYLAPRGVVPAAVGCVFGMVCGEFAGYVALQWFYNRAARRALHTMRELNLEQGLEKVMLPVRDLYWQLMELSLPIALFRVTNLCGWLAEASLVPLMLVEAGHSTGDATALYGELSGIFFPLLYLPTVIIFPFATAVLPAVSAANEMSNRHYLRTRLWLAIGLAAVLGLGVGGFFSLTAHWVATTLYGVADAAPMIQLILFTAPVSYMENMTAALLNGLGETQPVFWNTLWGKIVKTAAILMLISPTGWGIYGAIWAVTAGHACASVLNLWTLGPYLKRESAA